ncbi:preprotein translocase subunit SecF [Candidatus Woesearchaeota archaeon]|nr:preprotein translocase subunit SecF [Candidatus Woesearchaeota archaeon]
MNEKIFDFYLKNYKKFLYIPFIILLIAFILIGIKAQTTGDFINRDITLEGGVAITILYDGQFDKVSLGTALESELGGEVTIRILNSAARQIGFLIESDAQDLSSTRLAQIIGFIENQLNTELKEQDYSIESIGSSLGTSFFNQTIRAMIMAFIFMGIVVFLYFRNFVPSAAVILSALSDIIVTVAILNIIGIKMGTASIAALLMLIGYSIDTDIMLTTKMLKRQETELKPAFISAFKTGMTMTLTTLAAVIVALVFSQSEVIRQIMTVLLVGLIVDIINTWIQNAGLLVWYVQRK